jgi:Asp-tRNA(Asn)/Glu-tRNA(Gln) amidotransferase A subunit family amidase
VNHALLPAVALPLTGTGSPPVSLQVIGPPGADLALLALARAFEADKLVSFATAPVG